MPLEPERGGAGLPSPARAKHAGALKVVLKPNKVAKLLLRRKGKLKATARITFKPNGGKATSHSRVIRFKLKKPHKRAKHH